MMTGLAGRAARMLVVALVLAPAVLMSGCENDSTAPEIVAPGLVGTWTVTLFPGASHVEVTDQTVDIYKLDPAKDCYWVDAFTVVGVEDHTYEMERAGTGEVVYMTVDILEEDRIMVTYNDFTSEFVRWNGDLHTLDRCEGSAA